MRGRQGTGFLRCWVHNPGWWIVLCLLGALLPVARARAADSPGQSTGAWVEIRVAGSAAAVARTRVTAEELFHRLGVGVRVTAEQAEFETTPPGAEPPLLIAQVDFGSEQQPRLVLVEGATGVELDRRLLPRSSSLETAVESVVHVAYLMVESLLERSPRSEGLEPRPGAPVRDEPEPESSQSRPSTRRPRREPVTRPQGPQPTSARWSPVIDGGVRVSALALSPGIFLPGVGPALQPRLVRQPESIGLLLTGTSHLGTRLVFGTASAQLGLLALRSLFTYERWLVSRLWLMGGAGGGMDCYRVEPEQAAPGIGVRSNRSVIDPILTTVLGVRSILVGPAYLGVVGGVEFDLAPRRFVATVEGAAGPVVLELSRVRPVLSAMVAGSLAMQARSVSRQGRLPVASARPILFSSP